jgi:hypothetical protein
LLKSSYCMQRYYIHAGWAGHGLQHDTKSKALQNSRWDSPKLWGHHYHRICDAPEDDLLSDTPCTFYRNIEKPVPADQTNADHGDRLGRYLWRYDIG